MKNLYIMHRKCTEDPRMIYTGGRLLYIYTYRYKYIKQKRVC